MSPRKPVFLVTGSDLAPQALALLGDYEMVFAGKTPTEDDIVALCKQHDPVAIIVRYSKVGAAAMDAAPCLKVISKHGSGTDTIDKAAGICSCVSISDSSTGSWAQCRTIAPRTQCAPRSMRMRIAVRRVACSAFDPPGACG